MSDGKPDCYWTSTQTPRALKNRHGNSCENEDCRGCIPCPEAHCIICGIEHVDQRTCPKCIGATREDLVQIRRMFARLHEQTIEGGNEGKLEAARPIPGGEAMVMLSPGSHHGFMEYESAGDHMPTELLLATWEDDWRSMKGTPTEEPATVPDAVAYFDGHLSDMAQRHDAFDDFSTEIRQHRAHLEDVLHDGERIETGAPCKVCGRPLERNYGLQAKDDSWWCGRCKDVISPEDYTEHVARDSRRFATWLPTVEMKLEYRINRGTLQGWASKGYVRKKRDLNLGRTVYNVADAVAKRDQKDDDENGLSA
jgi:hypothetical protein